MAYQFLSTILGSNANFTGLVGIGTTSPIAMLDIYSPTNGYASVGLQGYSGATKWFLTSGISGVTIQDFAIGNNNNGTSPKLVITSSGNVLIGTTNDIGYKLQVNADSWTNGAVRISGANPFYFENYGGGWYMGDTTWVRTWNQKSVWAGGGILGSDGGLTIGYGGASGVPTGGAVIAGNVGIGTTSPNFVSAGRTVLDINGSSNTLLCFSVGGIPQSYLYQSGGDLNISNEVSGAIKFYTSGSERMRIASSGQVGINNSTIYHGANLSVANKIFLSFQPNADIGGTIYGYYDSSLGGYNGGLKFQNFQFNGSSYVMSDAMTINGIGNVGIGTTSPSYKLQISDNSISNASGNNTISVYGSSNSGDASSLYLNQVWNGYIYPTGIAASYDTTYGAAAAGLSFYTSAYNGSGVTTTKSMYINPGGNIGIGTTNINFLTPGRTVMSLNGASSSLMEFKVGDVFQSYIYNNGNTFEFYSSNRFDFYTAGVARLVIAPSGNVLIGTLTDNGSKLQVAGNATLGQGQNRPVTYDSNGGNFRITANPSGWATGYFFNGSSGTFRGGFGAYGDYDNMVYHWIGDDYNVPTMVLYPNQGSVGIGTTTPLLTTGGRGNLTINGSSSSILTLGVANSWRTYLFASSTYTELGSGGYTDFRVNGAGTFAMRLANSGNALIGTTTDNGAKLQVNGDAYFGTFINTNFRYSFVGLGSYNSYHTYIVNTNSSNGTYGLGVNNYNTSSDGYILGLSSAGIERFYVKNDGNVNASSLAGSGTRMVVADASGTLSTQAIPGGGGISGSGTTNYISKWTGSTALGNSLIYDNGTNVGIGTTSPSYILQTKASSGFVAGAFSSFYSSTAIIGTDNNGIWFGQGTNGLGAAYVINNTSGFAQIELGGAPRFFVNSSGNVGIGTTSPVISTNYGTLTIDGSVGSFTEYRENGTAYFRVGADGGRPFIYSITGAPIDFYISGTVAQRIASSGNVLIGTTTDNGYKLQVNGSATVSSQLVVGNTTGNGYTLDVEGSATFSDTVIQSLGANPNALGGMTSHQSQNNLTYNFVNNTYSGETITGEVAVNVNAGQILVLRNGALVWDKADASVSGPLAYNMIGIACGDAAPSQTVTILLRGFYASNSWYSSSPQYGAPMYLSPNTAGTAEDTIPSTTGNVVRIVGHIDNYSNNNGVFVLRFNPDNFWLVI